MKLTIYLKLQRHDFLTIVCTLSHKAIMNQVLQLCSSVTADVYFHLGESILGYKTLFEKYKNN